MVMVMVMESCLLVGDFGSVVYGPVFEYITRWFDRVNYLASGG